MSAAVPEAPAAPRKPGHAPSPWPRAGIVALIAAVVVTVIVLAFAWPSKTQEARDLPVSVAGPQEAVQGFEDAIDQAQPGAFAFTAAADRADAERQIQAQETVGGIVFGEGQEPPEVLSASAAGNVPSQAMNRIAQQVQGQIRAGLQEQADGLQQQAQESGAQPSPEQAQQLLGLQRAAAVTEVAVTDVVPLSEDDPTGAGFAAASFPLVLGGIIGGVLINTLVHGLWRRLGAAVLYALLAGLSLDLILNSWFGFVQGGFLVDWMVFTLSVLGTSSFILGCTALIGPPGIGVGAVVTMFLGNPLSGAQVPWQFYPHPWGWIGQHLVPGAAQRLLRTESFFPDASGAEQWWTLIAWSALGLVLTVVGYLVHHHGRTSDAAEDAPTAGGGVLDPEGDQDRPAPRHRTPGVPVS
ncbi:ABC transporter permease [Rothia sp. AR01]|uniref:ABC transporter permease n=1 Tax=Rothia santali TaxID=2949643 RepID=A0A9X2KHS3_9MICC|nr:ABC transporter permease [Rothia santali]MCP3426157.1 ABC transporter permease [Rothia santali]